MSRTQWQEGAGLQVATFFTPFGEDALVDGEILARVVCALLSSASPPSVAGSGAVVFDLDVAVLSLFFSRFTLRSIFPT